MPARRYGQLLPVEPDLNYRQLVPADAFDACRVIHAAWSAEPLYPFPEEFIDGLFDPSNPAVVARMAKRLGAAANPEKKPFHSYTGCVAGNIAVAAMSKVGAVYADPNRAGGQETRKQKVSRVWGRLTGTELPIVLDSSGNPVAQVFELSVDPGIDDSNFARIGETLLNICAQDAQTFGAQTIQVALPDVQTPGDSRLFKLFNSHGFRVTHEMPFDFPFPGAPLTASMYATTVGELLHETSQVR